MAKAKRDRRTSIRNIGAGDDALAALERLDQLDKQHEAARAKNAEDAEAENRPADERDD